jgi:hypothetical protein
MEEALVKMKNFGNSFGILLLLTFCLTFPILSTNIQFTLTNNKLALGEVVFLDVKLLGESELKPIENRYESNGVQVYFVGNSFETQIINFKVTKSSILKYQVSSNKLGKHKIPTVKVIVDNQIFESPEMYIEVLTKSNSTRTPAPSRLLDHFFGESEPLSDNFSPPEVVFHTNKNLCYLGEPVIGYYVLYYNGLRQPFLERDPNHSISFPFFLSETLNQVTVQIDPSVKRNGFDRNTLVYLKEIYGLTPLRSGTYSIGSTNFIVGDSLRFDMPSNSTPVTIGTIRVLPLPGGAPKNFSGAIGEYELSFHSEKQELHLGESFYFSIRAFGSGAGTGLDDPLELKNNPSLKEFHLVRKEKSKVFRKLPEGEFGFYSVVEFFYSFQSDKEGKRELPTANIYYFSPRNGIYETKSATSSAIFVGPKKQETPSNIIEKLDKGNDLSNFYLWLILILVVTVSFVVTSNYMIKNKQIRTSMVFLNGKIGTKKGEILKDYLLRHGVSETDASTMSDLSLAFTGQSWDTIYKYCTKNNKQILVKLSNILNK